MLKAAIAVIVGYVASLACTRILMVLVRLAAGHDFAFAGGTHYATTAWAATCVVLALVGGYFGGWTTVAIGGGFHRFLAGLILVLGLTAVLAPQGPRPAPEMPDVDLGIFDVIGPMVQPAWYGLLAALLQAFGVLIGGNRRLRA